ncbi:phospholipase D-like domain-containing protein [Solibacillus sp. MA9]|uniref:phospholipase D n=1 Tax=Solibacillus palustris TaxID=2908203 RepID=A0ABS9UGC5_9BACL|nr:phospholipase D-like domain-containing protein [Solibacillus sp. MA9]MCH7323420.1 phospholipase D-like domain-containing protein [Solibacillus sp. MA9]
MKRLLKKLFAIIILLLIIPLIVGIIYAQKPMPNGVSVDGELHADSDVRFVYDLTYDNNGRVMEQHLYDEMLRIIDEAEQTLVIDMFLYNDDYDRSKGNYPTRAHDITNAVLAAIDENPTLNVTIITDAINTVYGSTLPENFSKLQEAGAEVIFTDMEPLPDSNPLYSSIWRSYLQWWPTSQNGFLPNAFNPDGAKASFGSYFDMLNFKANHRKIVLNEQQALVTSANLTHDGSSYHSNIGFVVTGAILEDLYASEQAVAKLSNITLKEVDWNYQSEVSDVQTKIVTEGKIKKTMLAMLNDADANSDVKIGVFYLADRDVVKAIKKAAKEGATVQVIVDPNKDAFGLEKNGIPNRQVASELEKSGVEIRFYNTQGEQYHSKFLYVKSGEQAELLGGSANFTRRNIADYNLESNLYMKMPASSELATSVDTYFERLWLNENGQYTVDFEVYEDPALWKKIPYFIQETTGLSTF